MASQPMGIEYAKLRGYTIYQFENRNGYNYFLSIPDQYVKNYQMFIGFPTKDLRDLPKKDVINEIDEIKKMITSLNKDGIYLLPDIPVEELKQAALENDGKKYDKILKEKITPMISEAYQILASYNTAERSINQVIIFVKQTESDRKFVDWFEMNMPNFVHGITYAEIKKYYYERLSEDIYARDEEKEKIFENPNKYDRVNSQTQVNDIAAKYQLDDPVKSLQTERPAVQSIQPEQQQPYQFEAQKRTSVKKRVLTKPNTNNYGFSNVFKMLILLSAIMGIGIIIANIIL